LACCAVTAVRLTNTGLSRQSRELGEAQAHAEALALSNIVRQGDAGLCLPDIQSITTVAIDLKRLASVFWGNRGPIAKTHHVVEGGAGIQAYVLATTAAQTTTMANPAI
jgi:hypothetical protein